MLFHRWSTTTQLLLFIPQVDVYCKAGCGRNLSSCFAGMWECDGLSNHVRRLINHSCRSDLNTTGWLPGHHINESICCVLTHEIRPNEMCLYLTHTATKEIITVIPALFLPCAVEGCRGTSLHFTYRCLFLFPKRPNTFVDCRQQRAWCTKRGAACFTNFPWSSAEPSCNQHVSITCTQSVNTTASPNLSTRAGLYVYWLVLIEADCGALG